MRIALGIAAVLGAMLLPPWIPAICIVLLALRYRAWEVIFVGLLIDLTWQPLASGVGILHMIPVFTLSCILVVWAFEPIRTQFLN